MSAAEGLLQMCRVAMLPEPFVLIAERGGGYRFADGYSAPWKTVIDPLNLPFGNWCKLFHNPERIEIEIGGKAYVYDRIGIGLHGEWVCGLRRENADAP